MPQPVQLVQFDSVERDALLAAGQPKSIEAALRAVTTRIKQHLKTVTELASDKSVGASSKRLTEARAGIEASLAVLTVCPAGEIADLRKSLETARDLVDEALRISATGSSAGADPRASDSPSLAYDGDSAAEYGLSAPQ
ncbi:hypothetical protein ACFYXM_27950 [Streptomyces sp. NPDC002476]|uniref:hypothetical protein n=1 Tax=Streptomyces sp. NPDC002476 TaxID=3364648 RepID=UPI00369F4978